MSKFKQMSLLGGGTACVALGVIGMFLPILPTTPFLLLAAFCYARSSRRFYDGLVTNRWCGAYIRNYREGHGISRQHKVGVILLLWLTMGGTMGFAVSLWWVQLILVVIAVAVTVHVLKIRTYRPIPCRSGATDIPAPPAGQAMIPVAINKRKVGP